MPDARPTVRFTLRRAAALCAALAVCALAAPTARAASAVAGPPVVVGAVISISGPFAPLGEPQRNALKLAQDDVNAHGGIGGRPLEIRIVDDEGKPDTSSQLTTQLIGQGVALILGGTITPCAYAISRVTAASHKLYVYMGPTMQVWQQRNGVERSIFEVQAHNELEIEKIVGYARGKLKTQKLAIMHDENQYGVTGERALNELAPKLGYTVVMDESYPTTATDTTGQLLKLKASGADTLIVWGSSPAVPLIVRQVRQLGLNVHIIAGSGIVSDNFLKVAGKDGESVYGTTNLNFTHPDAPTAALLTAYRNAYHARATVFAGQGWDGAHVAALALNGTKPGFDTDRMIAFLESSKGYHGATGFYRFTATDHNGLTLASVHVVVDHNAVWFVEN